MELFHSSLLFFFLCSNYYVSLFFPVSLLCYVNSFFHVHILSCHLENFHVVRGITSLRRHLNHIPYPYLHLSSHM